MIRFFQIIIVFFSLIPSSNSLEFYGNFTQGGLITGKIEKKIDLYVENKKIKISNDGYFVFGIPRDQGNKILIIIKKNNEIKKIIKKIKKRKFKIQRIDGLPKRKVTPNADDMKRIRAESKLIAKAKNINSNLSFFFDSFIRPVNGITTGVYGSQRILNGEPRRPHFGIDIAAPKGTKVLSSNSGKVVLSEKNLFFTGGTVIIDHGHGLISIYSHLEKVFVKKNQKVNKGEVIASVGSTGRSTGPHLDFRLYCNNVPVDPDIVILSN